MRRGPAQLFAGAVVLSACAAEEVSVGSFTAPRPDASDATFEPTEDPDAGPLDDRDLDAATEPMFPYIEAESGRLSGGFTVGRSDDASGGGFLEPPPGPPSDTEPGAARAVYTLAISRAGDYRIWGRIRSPGAASNRFWFQVDDGPFRKWRISVGDIWYWDTFHDDLAYGIPLTFPLSAGDHRLTIASCVEGVGLDRLYITADGDTPPGNDTPCDPPHSIELAGQCLASCGAQRGNMCGEAACAGQRLIVAYDCAVCCQASAIAP